MTDIRKKIRLVHTENGQLIALSYFVLANNCLYGNAIINKNESNIMRFIFWQALNYIRENICTDVQLVSIQGSEKPGQYSWKNGFRPVITLNKTHLVWESGNQLPNKI